MQDELNHMLEESELPDPKSHRAAVNSAQQVARADPKRRRLSGKQEIATRAPLPNVSTKKRRHSAATRAPGTQPPVRNVREIERGVTFYQLQLVIAHGERPTTLTRISPKKLKLDMDHTETLATSVKDAATAWCTENIPGGVESSHIEAVKNFCRTFVGRYMLGIQQANVKL